MRAAVIVASLVLLAAGAAHATGAPSGLRGLVTQGPITPVCMVGVPCSGPAGGAVLVFSRAGHQVARVTTKPDGSYRVRLAPATYAVRTLRRRLIEPTTARVWRGRTSRLDFSIDTGIR
jgi:hypothetical protein